MNNEKKQSAFMSFIKARNTKKGAVSITVTVLVIAAVILLNVIVGSLSTRYSLYADMTSNSAYRIQDVTVEFASAVSKEVDLYVLANETVFEGYGEYYVQADRLIRQFCECSDKIKLHYVDLTSDPSFPAKYPDVDWTASHLCLAVCGDRYRIIDAEDMFEYEMDSSTYSYVVKSQHIEQALATAVLIVTSDELTKVSVLKGQNEEDMSKFTALLENNAYDVGEVDLSVGTIPEDSQFLVIFAPAVDIDADMADQIREWLSSGNNLIYFPTDQKDVANFPNLNALMADYGMSVSFGYVYESDMSYVASAMKTSLCSRYDYADSTYTKDLRNPDIPVFLYYTMPVEITDSSKATAMLTSSEKAFFGPITDEVSEDFEPDYGVYNGAAVGEGEDSSHMVVIGSYDALSGGFLEYNAYNNAAYFVNIFNTLSEAENTGIVIEGKNLDSTALGAGSSETVGFVAFIARWFIPIGILLVGVIMFFIRRHK